MADNYWGLFLNSTLSLEDPGAALILMFLFLARMLPIIAQAPFFGARVLPHPVKVTFAISLFVIFLPQLLQVTTSIPPFNTTTLALFAKELFVGFLLGLLISIPFIIVQAAGMYIDHQRGGASLMVNDPTIQNQSSPIGTMFNLIFISIFFLIDGPFLFIDAISKSYELIPPDLFINHRFFEHNSAFWQKSVTLFNQVMKISVQLASPALIAILMTDVFLGIANRLATQVQITFLGLPLKSLLALAVIFVGWKAFISQLVVESYSWLNVINEMITMLRPPV